MLVGIGHEAVVLRPAVFRAAGLHGGILPVVGCVHPGIDGAMNLEPTIQESGKIRRTKSDKIRIVSGGELY